MAIKPDLRHSCVRVCNGAGQCFAPVMPIAMCLGNSSYLDASWSKEVVFSMGVCMLGLSPRTRPGPRIVCSGHRQHRSMETTWHQDSNRTRIRGKTERPPFQILAMHRRASMAAGVKRAARPSAAPRASASAAASAGDSQAALAASTSGPFAAKSWVAEGRSVLHPQRPSATASRGDARQPPTSLSIIDRAAHRRKGLP